MIVSPCRTRWLAATLIVLAGAPIGAAEATWGGSPASAANPPSSAAISASPQRAPWPFVAGSNRPASTVPQPANLAQAAHPPSTAAGAEAAGAGDVPDSPRSPDTDPATVPSGRSGFDQAMVARGRQAFDTSCTQCHDAQRALSKTKSLAGWLATVRRMAKMDDAEIDAGDVRPIATYLASRNQPTTDGTQRGGAAAASEAEQTEQAAASFSGTVAPLWRGGNDNLENPGFFVDAWLRADWQPTGPVSGRVTACTSCHSDATGGTGFTVELVEAYARLDLMHRHKEAARRWHEPDPRLDASVRAGRIVVPFGAFAAMSHPGIYRTVTNPLMYIMGRSVDIAPPRSPVLPMPYADEGADLEARLALGCDMTATLDLYAVNGLKASGPGIGFAASRSYVDNNKDPAVGGRATIGNRTVRLGGSVMSGQMQADRTVGPKLDYHFAGGDVVVRFDDRLRLYYEYAMRRNESSFGRGEVVYGNVVEGEVLLLSHPKISFLVRYDDLIHHDLIGDGRIERLTWGINTVLPGGSLLIVDHERWDFQDDRPTTDVVGLRWVATF